MSTIPMDTLLKVLANEKRREILRLLSFGDRYAYELAKMINITPRAVTKHLESLLEGGLVLSEKRKSDKGPDRDYFMLNKGLIVKISIAQNLFYANVSNLQESDFYRVNPALQLSAPSKKKTIRDVFEEGLNYLPEIRDELNFLELQQTRLLRKYQGMLMHMREMLKEQGLSSSETEFLVALIEANGKASQIMLLQALSLSDVTLESIVNSLMEKGLITYQIEIEENTAPVIVYELAEEFAVN